MKSDKSGEVSMHGQGPSKKRISWLMKGIWKTDLDGALSE